MMMMMITSHIGDNYSLTVS